MVDIVKRLLKKADEIDRAVSRDLNDREDGQWNEIELMREAAKEITLLRKERPNILQKALKERKRVQGSLMASVRELCDLEKEISSFNK